MAEPSPATCVIVDDHDIVRLGLKVRLEHDGVVSVVGDAETGDEGLALLRDHRPDVALIDFRIPGGVDGLDIASAVSRERLGTRVIMYSATADRALVRRAFAAGAYGFVAKHARLDIITSAVLSVMEGHRFVDPLIAADLLAKPASDLSVRELQVLQLLADGCTNSKIGLSLSLAEDTVKSQVTAILRKLGVSGRTEAVAEAFRRDLVE